MDVSLDSDVLQQLNTTEARSLHDISDKLSACGVGKIVNLPQIIVVGEQSAGKSSVLEAISHVRFPVEGNLCTRFATELVLRHARETRVDVSVRFADKSKSAQTFQKTGFREDDLPGIIKEAKECMGFTQTGKEFSKDVLRLEIEGPKMYPLSLVDLPGLFQTDTDTQSLGGKETVDELVESYMRQKNSIILVVITANNNLANHIALSKVKNIDPQRRRTIGVITKPDLTRAGTSGEREYVRVAKNQEVAHKLQLGWHVLRNRAEDETSLETRDQIEESFFKEGAWASIPEQDRGISSFRRKLSSVLFNHIRNSLPGVIEDIEVKLRERQEDLTRLGNPRSEHQDWRSFLLTIASDFQRLARDGCNGQYNDPFFGSLDEDDHKFRALLRNFNRVFDHILRTKGSTQNIVSSDSDESKQDDLPEYLSEFVHQYPYDFADPETVKIDELRAELEKKAAANQGREFPGSPNVDLAMQLFKKQAAPWKKIAQFHVETVITVAKAFVDQLFKHVIGTPQDNPTTEAILATCVDPFFEKKETELQNKVEELLRPYSRGYALPLDMEFYRGLSEKSTSRLANQVCKTLKDNYPEMFSDESKNKVTPERITQVMASNKESRDGEFGTDKVIDMMVTYYEMSRRTFTDNVINLAIESCLVCSIPDILTPSQVDRMSTERLRELAAEPIETTSRRTALQTEVETLRQGLAHCRRYRPRAITVLPSSKPSTSTSEPAAATSVSVTVTAPIPTTSTPTPLSQKPSGTTAVDANGNTTKQAPSLTTTNSAPSGGVSHSSSPRAAVPSSQPTQQPVTPTPAKVTGLFGNANPSSNPRPSDTTGGLFGGVAKVPSQPAFGSSKSSFGSSNIFGGSGAEGATSTPKQKPPFSFGTSPSQQPSAGGAGSLFTSYSLFPSDGFGGSSPGSSK
ncbi:hypothetical protein F53441_6786 [Fusarium austroafricanum]|uniref:Dynamin-type G domain-containing protein n=1 Tax=Fusarium austroafricanum TaxID=2364996 RepID=A0A8H4P6L4_9HYPO|nr:hypothetical protein F53441_6786 [Fusarium austroafricanum]